MSGFLLDTNIPSELVRSRPEPRVANWVYAKEEQSLYLSAVTIGELRRGFVLLPAGKRRTELELWFEHDLLLRFRDRILPVTQRIADRWGILDGECQLRGASPSTADAMIAATALEHDLIVVTRNVKDFAGLGVTIFNPWGRCVNLQSTALQVHIRMSNVATRGAPDNLRAFRSDRYRLAGTFRKDRAQ